MLLFSRKFFAFFCSFFLAAYNDNVFRNALVIMITYQSGLPSNKASAFSFLAMALLMMPQFFFSSLAGEVADKYPQHILFRVIKLVEVFLMMLTLLAFIFHQILLLLVLIFLMGTQTAFFSPVKYAYTPRNLPDRLLQGNALVSAGTYLSILLGTIVGNLLITCQHGQLITGSALLAVAALDFLAVQFIPHIPAAYPDLKINKNIAVSTYDTVKMIFQSPILVLACFGMSTFWMTGALYVSQLAGFCKEIIRSNEMLVMFFTLLFSAGVAVGSLLCSFFRKHGNILVLVPIALLLVFILTLDLFFACFSWVPVTPVGEYAGLLELLRTFSFWRFVADLFLIAVFSGFYFVPLLSVLQKYTEPSQMARVMAANNILNSAMIGVGTLVSILLIGFGLISVRGIFLLTALMNLAFVFILLPLHRKASL